MVKVLVTGSNSFIGTNFRKFSEFKDIEEISLRDNRPEDIDFGKYDVVLHLAAIVHESKKIPESEYFNVNRDLCLRVAENAKNSGVSQFVFLSTIKVYGEYILCTNPWNEDSVCFPEDAYGKSKYQAELGLKNLEDSDFIVSVIRTPLVYGPGVTANMLRLIRLIEKFPILPFDKVRNSRNYTYVENLTGFIDRIIQIRASGIFIVMDDKPFSTTDLVSCISGFLHKKPILFRVPEMFVKAGVSFFPSLFDRLYRSVCLENSKTKKLLKYSPPFSTKEGLEKMISSYLDSKKNII